MDIGIDELLELQFSNVGLDDDGLAETVSVRSVEDEPVIPEIDEETFVLDVISPNAKQNKYLKNEEMKQLFLHLFSRSTTDLKLHRGILKECAEEFGVSRWSVQRIWKEAVRQHKAGEEVVVASNKHKCGRKVVFFSDEALRGVPLRKRTTMRSFASALDVSTMTVHRLIRRGILRSHSNSIKPKLSEKHKRDRLKFILRFVVPATVREKPRFDMFYNMIHIDEKCFFMSKITHKIYLLCEEEDPYRNCQSKGFITKVMFMAVVARPWVAKNGDVLWDGKIGIFPFTEDVAAQRGSINRPRGTMETKPIQHINKDVIRQMILDMVLPTIRQKWSIEACKTIWIQQDNARPHTQPDDPAFLEAAKLDGFDINLIQQPAQSSDLNILDLRFFRAIQSIQHQYFPDTVSKLTKSVRDAYDAYEPRLINYTWLHLQYVMVEILKVMGGNNYKNQHIGKKKLERDELPLSYRSSFRNRYE